MIAALDLDELADLFGLDEELDWQQSAVCAQTDPDESFPEKGGSTRAAKKICAGCPVRAECLAYALEHQERFGIWGGLSERERRALIRASGRPPRVRRWDHPCGTPAAYRRHYRNGEAPCQACREAEARAKLAGRPAQVGAA